MAEPAPDPHDARVRRRVARKLLVSFASLAAFLVLGELGARLAGYGPHPSFLELSSDAELQLVPLPNQTREVPEPGGEPVPVRINAHGQRGADYPLEKPAGELRIVGLGDSLTFGKGVRDDETYLARLHEICAERADDGRTFRVVNAAFNGYATFHYRQWARARMERFDPDVLLVGLFVGNDMEVIDEDFGYGWLADLQRKSAPRHALVHAFRQTLWKRARATRKGTDVVAVEQELDEYRGLTGRDLDQARLARLWAPSLEHLREIHAAAEARNVRTVCVLLPTSWMTGRTEEPWIHGWLREQITALGMTVVAPLDELRSAAVTGTDPWLAHDAGHLSPAGHEIVARLVADSLALAEAAD
jgi:lysophospholipase L1-like esterase